MGIRFRHMKGYGPHQHRNRRTGVVTLSNPGTVLEVEDKADLAGAIHKFEQLDPDPEPPLPHVGLVLRPRGGGWFDVVNETTGKALNETALHRDDARALIWGVAREQEAGEPEQEGGHGADDEDAVDRP